MTNTQFRVPPQDRITTWHRSRREWAALPAQTSISALRLVPVTSLLCITTWLHFRVQKCLDVLCSNVYMSYSCIVESLLLEALSFLNTAALALDLQCTTATPHDMTFREPCLSHSACEVLSTKRSRYLSCTSPIMPSGKAIKRQCLLLVRCIV